MSQSDFLISKDNLRETKWVEGDIEPLAAGDVRLKLDAFALTANNVTYAAFGDIMQYWKFFPAGDGWGRVPVWGFATVAESNVAEIEIGRRVYGYFPVSATLDVTPAGINANNFSDSATHRADLAFFYNLYHFTDTDPAYDDAFEPQQMLFRPLYATGWWLKDTLTRGEGPALKTAILSSASSKTAMALAHALKSQGGIETVGLTSAGNKDFVTNTELYSRTLTYDEMADLTVEAPAAYVDFTGRPELTGAVHAAAGAALQRSLIVGVTDWEGDKTPPATMPGPVPEFFFVPDYAAARIGEDGMHLNQQMNTDLRNFYPASTTFVTPVHAEGQAAITKAWDDTAQARVSPDKGLILSLG